MYNVLNMNASTVIRTLKKVESVLPAFHASIAA
jgi:hypothetical protein